MSYKMSLWKSIGLMASIILSGQIVFISMTSHNFVSFHDPLVVRLSKTVPSFTAFEDSHFKVENRVYIESDSESHLLAGLEKLSPRRFLPRTLELSAEDIKVTPTKLLALREENIIRPYIRNTVTERKHYSLSLESQITLSQENIRVSDLIEKSFSEKSGVEQSKASLSKRLEQRLLLASGGQNLLDEENIVQPSFRERLNEEIRKELGSVFTDGGKWVRSSAGRVVAYVQGNNHSPRKENLPQKSSRRQYERQTHSSYYARNDRNQSGLDSPNETPIFQPGVYGFVNKSNPTDGMPFSLKGDVSVAGGLALTEKFSLAVYRTVNGEVVEEGKVSLSEGDYEIFISGDEGYIEGVLLDGQERIIGHGSVSLLKEEIREQMQNISEGKAKEVALNLVLDPVEEGFIGSSLSAYSYSDNKMGQSASLSFGDSLEPIVIKSDGQIIDRRWRKDSYLLSGLYRGGKAKVNQEKWSRGTISWMDLRERVEIKHFSETLVSSLKQWVPELVDNESALVWGRVVDSKGDPLPNAKVHVNDPNSRVYYFSGFLPDGSLAQTSSNGEFIIVGRLDIDKRALELEEGVQGIKVIYGEGAKKEVWPTEMIAVERGHVTTLELRAPKYKNIQISFEGSEGRQGQDVYFSSVDRPIRIGDSAQLKVPVMVGPTYVETSETLDLLATVSTLKPHSRRLRVPRVSKEWLRNLKRHLRIPSSSDKGVIFGWGTSSEYEVVLSRQSQSTSVAYFSQDGELALDSGVANGFFIIFNAPLGFNNVVVRDDYNELYGEAVYLENNNISIVDASRERIF